ncbi:Signal sequence receptor alpha chain [Rhizoctonia solani]|uniref:Signal sequence receptor alpha chain n=1 Tax=Rhizoctonia solani TaxID=456999 RepID=A0A8H7M3X4_9AGAM|nr:Signal sequence receptor alpha chain [Rhizoctonia solani]
MTIFQQLTLHSTCSITTPAPWSTPPSWFIDICHVVEKKKRSAGMSVYAHLSRHHALRPTLSQIVLLASAACAAVVAPVEPKLDISASFGEENPFARVFSLMSVYSFIYVFNRGGEWSKHQITRQNLNTSGANVTLVDIGGSYHDVDTGKTLRNVTARKFNLPIIEGMNLTFPYLLTSELRPKDTKLLVWANIKDSDANIFRMTAYDSIVSIVEPPSSIFDIQMILTYLMVLVSLEAEGTTPTSPRTPLQRKSLVLPLTSTYSSPSPETPGGAARYEEEWIPSHHLAGSGARARKVSRGEH